MNVSKEGVEMMSEELKPELDSSAPTNKFNGSFQDLNGKRLSPVNSDEPMDTDQVDEQNIPNTKRAKLTNGDSSEHYSPVNWANHTGELDRTSPHKPESNESLAENQQQIGIDPSKSVTNTENLVTSNGHNGIMKNLKLETNSLDLYKETPMDLTSHAVTRYQELDSTANSTDGGPDVITLSDSEDELQEVLSLRFENSVQARTRLLRKYREQLRNEEAKLVLLKKLKQSQNQPKHDASQNKMAEKSQGHHTGQKMSGSANVPPPLKRGSTPIHGTQSPHQKTSSHHVQQAHSKPHSSGPPPLVNMSHKASSSQHNGTSTGGSSSSAAFSYKNQQQSVPKTATPPQITPEQRQAQAKQALRKQLEKALLQIPPPKPPPPEMNFIPSTGSGEFTYLVGMEEVVKYLLDADKKQDKYVFNPFTCVQCNSDYTPVWKRDKPGSKNVICEQCVTTNQKKVLKHEHTNRLKAAFVKAVEQEQEIEKRISSGSPVLELQPPSVSPVQPAAHQPSTHSSSSTPAMPQLTAAQLRQHQTLLHAQAAEQMRAMLSAQALALPYQLYGVANKQAADLQRQYLLDMINPQRQWKT